MAKHPFKAFVPYTAPAQFHNWLRQVYNGQVLIDEDHPIRNFLIREPGETQWGNMGLSFYSGGQLINDLQGTALMLMIQFNQRSLPASVINEKLKVRIDDLEKRQGRKARKDEWAQIRDDVQAELLPKAFIKRTFVPVLVYKDKILVCSGSVKQVDSCMTFLSRLVDVCKPKMKFIWDRMRTEHAIPAKLRECALDGELIATLDVADHVFTPGQAIKLKGRDKRAVTFKDIALSNADMVAVIEDASFAVTEMALHWGGPEADPMVDFTLTDSGIFKGIKLQKGVMSEIEDDKDLHTVSWLFAKTARDLLADTLHVLGGLKPVETEEEEM